MTGIFLDRDGVINVENIYGYILNIKDFKFYDGVHEAIKLLNQHFHKTIVVTNQRCVGKGLISESDLLEIHEYLIQSVKAKNGKIDKVYFAPSINTDDYYRKPNIGMSDWILKDFPKMDFTKSVMVGNNISDMQFGRRLGMKTVFITSTNQGLQLPDPLIDAQFCCLKEYALSL